MSGYLSEKLTLVYGLEQINQIADSVGGFSSERIVH
jgi:hypothetical protein